MDPEKTVIARHQKSVNYRQTQNIMSRIEKQTIHSYIKYEPSIHNETIFKCLER